MELHVKTLSRLLAQLGHEVTVATGRLPGTAEEETTDGVRIRRITGWAGRALAGRYERSAAPIPPPMPDPGVVAGLTRIIGEARPDIVQAQGWISYSCLAVRRRQGFRLVVGLHDYRMACARRTMMRHDDVVWPRPRLPACLRCAPGQYRPANGAALPLAPRAPPPLPGRAASWLPNSHFI